MITDLVITSPKRIASAKRQSWEAFFPYYAGYPETFAANIIRSANLPSDGLIVDPWNGSGTTTFAATMLTHQSVGIDLNPVMVIVSKSRLLSPSEADSLVPIGKQVIQNARFHDEGETAGEPLELWFNIETARYIRSLDQSIRRHLVGEATLNKSTANLQKMSGIAATNYVALFAVVRNLAQGFRSSNPTWIRTPKSGEMTVEINATELARLFLAKLQEMSDGLASQDATNPHLSSLCDLRTADATEDLGLKAKADLVLTSPPYCTRIDYTSATRLEIALLYPLTRLTRRQLRQKMIGSTLVPAKDINADAKWGPTCLKLIEQIKSHKSVASAGYYLKTHLDYFSKMARALPSISSSMKAGATAILVVQGSKYKEIDNDLPTIIAEMAEYAGLHLKRREDFFTARSMARLNPRAGAYGKHTGATEAVLCFRAADVGYAQTPSTTV